MVLENIGKSGDFQAEYEGSIPFTRSNDLKWLARVLGFILTSAKSIPAIRLPLVMAPAKAYSGWPIHSPLPINNGHGKRIAGATVDPLSLL
jgi:hypothetical protein